MSQKVLTLFSVKKVAEACVEERYMALKMHSTFKTWKMDDVEEIVHGAMLASGALLKAKNDGAKVAVLLLLLGLFVC